MIHEVLHVVRVMVMLTLLMFIPAFTAIGMMQARRCPIKNLAGFLLFVSWLVFFCAAVNTHNFEKWVGMP